MRVHTILIMILIWISNIKILVLKDNNKVSFKSCIFKYQKNTSIQLYQNKYHHNHKLICKNTITRNKISSVNPCETIDEKQNTWKTKNDASVVMKNEKKRFLSNFVTVVPVNCLHVI